MGADDALGQGLPVLLLDFKRFFCVPMEELLKRLTRQEVRRRTRLATPFAEHLSVRFGFFLQRVGLDREHHDLAREMAQ